VHALHGYVYVVIDANLLRLLIVLTASEQSILWTEGTLALRAKLLLISVT
jgi:hypothetical protein